MTLKKWILAALTAVAGTGCSDKNSNQNENIREPAFFSGKVVYGNDSRRDWYEVLDENLLHLANSTVGLIDSNDVTIEGSTARIETSILNLCPGEKFNGQKSGPWCSGFLVAPDLVVTAGHCVTSSSQCANIKFVFGYAKKTDSNDPASIKASDVYGCSELIDQKLTEYNTDWAVIKLDRPVTDRAPLKIRRHGEIQKGTPLTLIGHPSGLPSKIARDGKARDLKQSYFRADLDSYGGNSGSAVFNALTNEVEGVLVRGRTDYKRSKNGCYVSNVCEEGVGGKCDVNNSYIKAEHVTKISEVLHLIPELPEEDDDTDDDNEEDAESPDEASNTFYSNVLIPIPDNALKKSLSVIKDVSTIENTTNLKISLSLEHTYISDLSIRLIAPNGKSILLHNRTGRMVVNIEGVYGVDLNSAEEISSLGAQPKGDWSLEMIDHTPYDKGILIRWGLIL